MNAGPLTFHTTRLDRDVDLLDVAGHDGVVFEKGHDGLAGRGEALRIEIPGLDAASLETVTSRLAQFEGVDDVGRPGTGVVAFAALPFAPDAAAAFVVPELVVGRAADGARWVTRLGAPADEVPIVAPTVAEPRARRFEVESVQDPDAWMETVRSATKRIADGEFDKVVLAREIRVTADAPIARHALLTRLRRSFPGCFTFAVGSMAAGSMIGASPELLVSRAGEMVHAHPMAGTAPRGGDPSADARLAASLLASSKDRAEHQITIDMVWDTLLPFCSYVDSEPEPSVVAVANVQHLASLVEGRLSQPAASVLELVAALHPTPAVAGWPLEPALAHLAAHEGLDRDRYAGAVGWVDGRGNGTWAVGIRSAIVDGATARLFAGVGVVADSDPQAELAETDAKFQAVLSAILRP